MPKCDINYAPNLSFLTLGELYSLTSSWWSPKYGTILDSSSSLTIHFKLITKVQEFCFQNATELVGFSPSRLYPCNLAIAIFHSGSFNNLQFTSLCVFLPLPIHFLCCSLGVLFKIYIWPCHFHSQFLSIVTHYYLDTVQNQELPWSGSCLHVVVEIICLSWSSGSSGSWNSWHWEYFLDIANVRSQY